MNEATVQGRIIGIEPEAINLRDPALFLQLGVRRAEGAIERMVFLRVFGEVALVWHGKLRLGDVITARGWLSTKVRGNGHRFPEYKLALNVESIEIESGEGQQPQPELHRGAVA
jgi:hypothetical protein